MNSSFNGDVNVLVGRINAVIIDPLLALLFAAGLVVFLWGLVQFLMGLSAGSEKTEEGKQHMLWGIVGMFIMVAAAAIIRIITNTFGFETGR
jgi:hypothetical protein